MVKILKVLAILAVVVVVAFVAIYLCGQFEQTRWIYNAVFGLFGQAKTFYVENPVNASTITAAVGTVSTFGGIALSKVQSYKKQALAVKDEATDKLSALTAEKDKIAATVTSTKSEFDTQLQAFKIQSADELAKVRSELQTTQNSFAELQQQKASLQTQLEDAKKQLEKTTTELNVYKQMKSVG